MPNTHETLTSLFSDIADAIRAKTGGESDIVADDFPAAIAAISGGYSTLTTITGTTGSKTVGSEARLAVSYTDSLISEAQLYCIIYSDIYTTSYPSLSFIVFTPDGTIVGRYANTISVSVADGNYTVSINKSTGTGQTYRYTFRGFALS